MTNTHNTSLLRTSATCQVGMNSDGGHISISSQHGRKRDKFLKLFRSAKSEETAASSGAQTATDIQKIGAGSTKVAASPANVRRLAAGTQITTKTRKARSDIFTKNEDKPAASIEVPKTGARINSTPQLALCSSLLNKSQGDQNQTIRDQANKALRDAPADRAHLDWIKAIQSDPIEQDHIRWLGTCIVEEFSKDALKNSAAITEVVFLGPVLDREHYRKLLNCFISEFEMANILDVDLLHGLIQLVQCASEGYLVADDLVKILTIIRVQLQITHQQSTSHSYHLALAVSQLLDAMAELKVQDVKRVEEHEPLSEVLTLLQGSSDPFLMYQASYAFQALQYVPDDETALQAILRHSTAVVDSLVKISGVLKMDLGSVLDGLKGFQEAISSTYDTTKSGYEGFRLLTASGRGVFDSLKEGVAAGHKRPWYLSLRAADAFLRQGQLADLNKLIVEAPCRRDPLFQWGICQMLGEVAVDETWENITHQQAIDLLENLYVDDMEWAQDDSVKGCMLAVITKLGTTSDSAIKDHANNLLASLTKDICSATVLPYPLKARLPMPKSSPLLNRVQEIPYVEYKIQHLKRQRLEEDYQPVYIPPMAKSSPQASDDDVFPLMAKVTEFLNSDRQVMLILGDSGAGKSTFNRHLECELWRIYHSGGKVPLFINMPALNKPESELIAEQLRIHRFSDAQIQELEEHRQLIIICDGYDESQLTTNLHTTNRLNRPGRTNVKLVVSCRSQYLGQDYHKRFVPQGSNHYSAPASHLFQEAVITPFSKSQIQDYVEQYVPLEPRTWVTKDYMEKLTAIPHLMDLVRNPFLLILSLGALPSVVHGKKDLTSVRITRVALYDNFVGHWIKANKRRLEKQKLLQESQIVLDDLAEDDFERNGIDFQKSLAAAIFQKHEGKPVVDYTHHRDKKSWKAEFFGPEPEQTLLRSCSLLNRVGNQYRFIHRSILDYFYSRFLHEPSRYDDDSSLPASLDAISSAELTANHRFANHPLSQRSLVSEPSVIQFLGERVQEEVLYKEHLLTVIERSKTDPNSSHAASNAITILVRAGVTFNGANLQGIQIPGADLSGGQFDSAQLQEADLSNTNLRNIWLRQADLRNVQMDGAQFGEWPSLKEAHTVKSCAYAPDGKTFVVGLENGEISMYKTATWEKTNSLSSHTGDVISVVISPCGLQIASGSRDATVRLWDAETGTPGVVLSGHSSAVTSVAFSSNGQRIASGSRDRTVRLWDSLTGAPSATLHGYNDWVTSVVFSPTGEQLASSSKDGTVRLWDAQAGALNAILIGHTRHVRSLVFSPGGQQISSSSDDGTVRLWDAQTGTPGAILHGATGEVTSVAFSPSGHQIVAGSGDKTVRVWDVQTGEPGAILSGHTGNITSVVFSPSGHQIASGSDDKTVRLWDAKTGIIGSILGGQSGWVTSVAFSPNGQQLAIANEDDTVQLWDARSGTPCAMLSGHSMWVSSLAFAPDGLHIASGSDDETVRVWNAQTGADVAVLEGHTGNVTSVVFSPRGQQIASGSHDSTVRVWDAQTGEDVAVLEGHTGNITSVVFSPCGHQIASGSDDKTVRLWDAETGITGATLHGHSGGVTSVAFSPSGQLLASGSGDATVRLRDAGSSTLGTVLRGHTEWVTSLTFSPSGQQIASGSADNTVRLWDMETSRCLTVVGDFYASIESIAWRENGNDSFIATGCDNGTVRLWQVLKDTHVVQLRWSTMHDRLTVSDTIISDVQGLSRMNMKLLEQQGAVVQPIPLAEA